MLSESQNLSANTVKSYLEITNDGGSNSSYNIIWPSIGAKENPHLLILEGFSPDGITDNGAPIGKLDFGADAFAKAVFWHDAKNSILNLFPNAPALLDLTAFLNIIVPEQGQTIRGMVNIKFIQDKFNIGKKYTYPIGIPTSLSGSAGFSKYDGQGNIIIEFQSSNKPIITDI